MPSPSPNPSLIPRNLLLGNPERGAPQLSPDGLQLSFVAPPWMACSISGWRRWTLPKPHGR